jgi:DNA-binding transcriptional ArsR family regulator
MADGCDLLCLDVPLAETLRARRLDAEAATAAAGRARALGDPTRLVIAAALRDGGELCVCDLAWILERQENLVSHHVRSAWCRSRRSACSVSPRSSPCTSWPKWS